MRRLLDGLRTLVYATAFLLFWGWLGLSVRPLDDAFPLPLPAAARTLGAALMAVGGALALACVALFATRGRGTPAPFDPPRRFVAVGPYRWVRNPMYVGGITLFVGFGLWHRSPSIVLLAGLAWGLFHLFVMLVEEPGLKQRFGADYEAYLESVPRWIPSPPPADATARLETLLRRWDIRVRARAETGTSLLAFGTSGGRRVVLKAAKASGDEWDSGEVAAAFDGHGVIRVYERAPGAALLEEAVPGRPLADLVEAGRDDEATGILAGVMRDMSEASPSLSGIPAADDWGRSFDACLAGGREWLLGHDVAAARDRYRELCRTQGPVRLLHGDLQHYNVLEDDARGWLAIDPKGVVAEPEYEIGASLRNPGGRPDLQEEPAVERRVARLVEELDLDATRALEWAYAQAVLSAIWMIEDGEEPTADGPAIRLASTLASMLSG